MFGHLGEIRLVAFNFVPINYVLCDGRRFKKYQTGTIPTALYSIVGDAFTYDNSDPNTFAIPDLRDRFALQPESSALLGEKNGNDEIVLSMDQMPEHNHNMSIEVDNSNGGEEPVNAPNNAFLNNHAGVFSSDPSEDVFFAGISQENVGNSEPVQIKNAHVKMVYVMCVVNDPAQSGIIGEIKMWPNAKTGTQAGSIPKGWRLCNGDTLRSSNSSALYAIIGYHYGGNVARNEFKLPDFSNKFASGTTEDKKVGETGGRTSFRLDKNNLPPHKHDVKLAVNNNADSSPHVQIPNNAYLNNNAGLFSEEVSVVAQLGGLSEEDRGSYEEIDVANSSLGLNHIICVEGIVPNGPTEATIGEVKQFAGFNPGRLSSFTSCSGQTFQVNSNQNLFSLIGTMYGGDGKTTFKIPQLKNRIPLCVSNLDEVGQSSGANTIKLTPENLPEHNHNVQLAGNHGADGRRISIPNGILNKDAGMFSTKESENAFLGGVEEHTFVGEEIDIRNPFLAINYLICLQGLFPSRS